MALFKKHCVYPVVIWYPVMTSPAPTPTAAAPAEPVRQAPVNLRKAKG